MRSLQSSPLHAKTSSNQFQRSMPPFLDDSTDHRRTRVRLDSCFPRSSFLPACPPVSNFMYLTSLWMARASGSLGKMSRPSPTSFYQMAYSLNYTHSTVAFSCFLYYDKIINFINPSPSFLRGIASLFPQERCRVVNHCLLYLLNSNRCLRYSPLLPGKCLSSPVTATRSCSSEKNYPAARWWKRLRPIHDE